MKAMDWQEPVAIAIVAATAATFVARAVRSRRDRFAKSTPCGCVPRSPSSLQGLRIEGRRGEQPRISVVGVRR
jgi:hypothetical protein